MSNKTITAVILGLILGLAFFFLYDSSEQTIYCFVGGDAP